MRRSWFCGACRAPGQAADPWAGPGGGLAGGPAPGGDTGANTQARQETTMNHPVQCRCGSVRGQVEPTEGALRGVCYCKDCQAYAHWLGSAGDVLDPAGGTELVAVQPAQLRITQGRDRLQCVTLSDKGPL